MINRLNAILIDMGRLEDLKRAVREPDCCLHYSRNLVILNHENAATNIHIETIYRRRCS